MYLKNKKVCITGASSGIGYALAKKLSQNNNHIIAVSRNLYTIQTEHPNWSRYNCDLSQTEEVEELCMQLCQEHPDLDILVNNAGIQQEIDLQASYEWTDVLTRELSVNLHAQIQLTLGILPVLLARKEAGIVNITSVLGTIPKYNVPMYSASKAGFAAFSKSLRGQLQNSPVSVFEVIPPLVSTAMNQDRPVKKMSVQDFVKQVIIGLEKGKASIRPGKAGLIMAIHRLLPSLAAHFFRGHSF